MYLLSTIWCSAFVQFVTMEIAFLGKNLLGDLEEITNGLKLRELPTA